MTAVVLVAVLAVRVTVASARPAAKVSKALTASAVAAVSRSAMVRVMAASRASVISAAVLPAVISLPASRVVRRAMPVPVRPGLSFRTMRASVLFVEHAVQSRAVSAA